MSIKYTKPKNLRYVDMCIWIDKNAYGEDCDDIKLYEYLYHLCRMLARKRSFFDKTADLDDFAAYAATEVFMRFRDSRQFGDGGSRKIKKIKNTLDYLKKVIHPKFLDYINEAKGNQPQLEESEWAIVTYDFHNKIQETLAENRIAEFDCILHDIPSTIRKYMVKIPVSRYSAEWENIYISCLLTFLNAVTLSKSGLKKVEPGNGRCSDCKTYTAYRYEREKEPILFHLENNMSCYVQTLTNIIMRLVARDISESIDSDIYAEDHAHAVFMDSLGMTREDD